MKKVQKRRSITKDQHQVRLYKYLQIGIVILAALIVLLVIVRLIKPEWFSNEYREISSVEVDASKPDLDVQLLTVNPYSRPGTSTNQINGIVVHYTANPGATAMENRDYFEGLKESQITQASSNFIVGLDGEIVQCVPTWEVAYASNNRNIDTVSIECCHPDETGEFEIKTYESMVQLCAWLCLKFGLNENDVIRHYDVTGKNCPKYFVENEEAFTTFRADIKAAIEKTNAQ